MKTIQESELYENLTAFLKAKGIVLTDGSYSKAVQSSCALLTQAINLGQRSLERAGTELKRKADQMRQCVHEKTAPKAKQTAPPPPTAEAAPAESSAAQAPGASAPIGTGSPKPEKAAAKAKTPPKLAKSKKPVPARPRPKKAGR